jgi:hypothetical protein
MATSRFTLLRCVFAILTGRSARALSRAAVLTTVLALALLPRAVPALAQAQRTALVGTEQRFFGVPARVWVADGLTQIRGLPLTGTFAYSGAGVTLAGPETQLANGILDAHGNGITWGVGTYTDAATGVTCTGPVRGKITNFLATLNVVAPCSDGALLKGTLQDIETFPPGQAPPIWVRSDFNGVLLRPG